MSLDRIISYTLTFLLIVFGWPFLFVGFAPALGGLDYNPEFDALGAPIGLAFLYAALYNLRLTHPRMPWPGTPSVSQGCAFSWVGFFVLATVLIGIGAMLGRRGLDLASLAAFWGIFVVLPFALAWLVRALLRSR